MKDWAKYPLEVMARGHVLDDEELREMCAEIERLRKERDALEKALRDVTFEDGGGVFVAYLPVSDLTQTSCNYGTNDMLRRVHGLDAAIKEGEKK